MNNPLVDIFNHFGEEAQLEKLKEEVNEFIEAVQSGDIAHMEEEYADVMVCMAQFMYAKPLSETNIRNITTSKTVRTIERIITGHYENK